MILKSIKASYILMRSYKKIQIWKTMQKLIVVAQKRCS